MKAYLYGFVTMANRDVRKGPYQLQNSRVEESRIVLVLLTSKYMYVLLITIAKYEISSEAMDTPVWGCSSYMYLTKSVVPLILLYWKGAANGYA